MSGSRGHEGCYGCPWEKVEPPKCSGHEAGPSPCSERPDADRFVKPMCAALGCTKDRQYNGWCVDHQPVSEDDRPQIEDSDDRLLNLLKETNPERIVAGLRDLCFANADHAQSVDDDKECRLWNKAASALTLAMSMMPEFPHRYFVILSAHDESLIGVIKAEDLGHLRSRLANFSEFPISEEEYQERVGRDELSDARIEELIW